MLRSWPATFSLAAPVGDDRGSNFPTSSGSGCSLQEPASISFGGRKLRRKILRGARISTLVVRAQGTRKEAAPLVERELPPFRPVPAKMIVSPPVLDTQDNDAVPGHHHNGHASEGVENGHVQRVPVVMGTSNWMDKLDIPPRFQVILRTSLAFVICNMDKVNMSIAIIPMSHQFLWTNAEAGIVQSSFFWGYLLCQLPGGWLAQKFTGQRVLRGGVFLWSAATAVLPLVTGWLPGLLFSRVLVGLGEGLAPCSAVDLIARTMPKEERSRAIAVVFGGLNVGSVLGLLVAPYLISEFGWESVFYMFGVAGVLWSLSFNPDAIGAEDLLQSDRQSDKHLSHGATETGNGGLSHSGVEEVHAAEARNGGIHAADAGRLNGAGTASSSSSEGGDPHAPPVFTFKEDEAIPWMQFLKFPGMWAMTTAHFCGNWGHYALLAWLPTYLSDELQMDLTAAALVSILPPLASIAVSSFAAPFADGLIRKGVPITQVRKLCQTIAFVGPSVSMGLVCAFPQMGSWATVALLTGGLGLYSFSFAGLYCSHQDISPKYASILLGMTNTIGSIPGIVGIAATGLLLDATHSWEISLFGPAIFFYVFGTLVWNGLANNEPQDFDGMARAAQAK